MEKLKTMWLEFLETERNADDWWARKIALFKEREAEIVRITGEGRFFQRLQHDGGESRQYLMHLSFLVKQGEHFYMEEQVIPYQFRFIDGEITNHERIQPIAEEQQQEKLPPDLSRGGDEQRFSYDRLAAVKYAERWWNSYNPAYQKFHVDCTNYISQCLFAGGAPMRGAPVRARGWWYQGENWSFSWAVANALRWHLSGSTQGLKGKEVPSAENLEPGDVICYDFQGDGRWDHNTMVVAKDANGMPLVNAHTDNSRHRYWSYEDSTAWTPNMQYKFFRIGE